MSTDTTDVERATLVALLRARPRGLSWPRLMSEVLERGSAHAAWDALQDQSLFDTAGHAPQIAEAVSDIAEWRAAGLGVHGFLDRDYPAQLREIHNMPPLLFSRGTLGPDEHAISVVGSRRASDAGRRFATVLAEALVETGITVVSGLAEGIDTAAHTAALNAGGRTVAVIGTGIRRAYPAANADLQERIAREGLVLSQFWPDAPPTKSSFPLRNATMSGYGRATVVVEAGETSGARIQARVGVEHGRPVILTDTVVRSNEWERQLHTRPGVHVANTVDEVLAIISETGRSLDEILAGAFSDAGPDPSPERLSSIGVRTVRDRLVGELGGYLRNVIREPGQTCSVCTGPVGSPYIVDDLLAASTSSRPSLTPSRLRSLNEEHCLSE